MRLWTCENNNTRLTPLHTFPVVRLKTTTLDFSILFVNRFVIAAISLLTHAVLFVCVSHRRGLSTDSRLHAAVASCWLRLVR